MIGKPVENILILQLKRMGDIVQTLPLLRRLKEEHPACRITVVCLKEFKGILADGAHCDRLVPIPIRDLVALPELARQADFRDIAPFNLHGEFREQYDLLINLSTHPGSILLSEKIPAFRKIGCISAANGVKRIAGPWPKYAQAMINHRTENLFNTVDMQMCMAGLLPKPLPPCLAVADEAAMDVQALMKAYGLQGDGRVIGLLMGASKASKAWPLEKFVELARGLIDQGGAEIVLLGDGKERKQATRFQEMLDLDIVDLVGRTSLPQLAAACRRCDLVVGNDTGPLHIASAVGTRTLGLFFSTAYFAETGPYGEGHAVLQVEISCSPCHPSSMCQVQKCKDHMDVASVRTAIDWTFTPDAEPPRTSPTLSLYRSRFLSNGSLLYAPARTDAVSNPYLSGLLGRLLWESAAGMPQDAELEAIWFSLRRHGDWGAKCYALSETLSSIHGPVRLGLQWAAQLGAEFAKPAPNRNRIELLEGQLAGLSASLAATGVESGLWGKLLLFEMLDMEYQAYPAMADVLACKYGYLNDSLTRVQETLGRLSRD